MPEIGKRIRLRREELGMTQEELASRLGYKSKTTIAKIENGTNDIVQSKVIEFAQILNTTPAYLLGWSESLSDKSPELTARDERDIKKDLDSLREKLENKEYGPAAYDGQDIPDEDVDLFLGQVELMLRRLKVKNKEKYNPNKNKK